MRWRQTPGLCHQIVQFDFPAMRQLVLDPCDNERALPQQDFQLRMIGGSVVRKSADHQIDLAVSQLAFLKQGWVTKSYVKLHARVILEQFADDLAHESRGHGFGSPNAQFASRWVSQGFQFADTGSQIVENGRAASRQRAPVDCRLNPLGRAVKKRYSEQAFQLCDRL